MAWEAHSGFFDFKFILNLYDYQFFYYEKNYLITKKKKMTSKILIFTAVAGNVTKRSDKVEVLKQTRSRSQNKFSQLFQAFGNVPCETDEKSEFSIFSQKKNPEISGGYLEGGYLAGIGLISSNSYEMASKLLS